MSETVFCPLTTREMQVMQLMTDGLTSKEMARILECAPRSIDYHRQNIIAKLQAKSFLHAVVIAMRMGLIQ